MTLNPVISSKSNVKPNSEVVRIAADILYELYPDKKPPKHTFEITFSLAMAITVEGYDKMFAEIPLEDDGREYEKGSVRDRRGWGATALIALYESITADYLKTTDGYGFEFCMEAARLCATNVKNAVLKSREYRLH
jgi:hypothetical protein